MKPVQYTITAVDRATQVIDKISNRVERLTQPFSRLGRSINRFGDVTGVNKLSKGIGFLTSQATSLLGVILKIGTPLLALFGGGSVMGIYRMTEGWAQLGSTASTTSKIIGISSQKFMEWRGVGDLVGVSAETMTSGFQGLADTLQDAKWGRNQTVFGMLKMLNIDLKHTKSGVIDTEAVLYQLADRIQKVQKKDPAAARKLAESFGVGALLPVLMNGSKAMRSYQAEVKRLQGEMTPDMINRADGFAEKLRMMNLASQGTKAAIADKLIPVFQPLIEKWTEWLVLNRADISDKIAKLAERLANWLDKIDFEETLKGITKFIDGCVKIVKWIDNTVEKFGGWESVLKVVGIAIGVGFVANIGLAVASLVGIIGKLTMATVGVKTLGLSMGKLSLGVLGKGALGVGAAFAGGWGVGSLINKYLIEGTDFGDSIGRNIARILAFFGNDSAKESLDLEKKNANSNSKLPATIARPQQQSQMPEKIKEMASKTYGPLSFDRFKKSLITQESGGDFNAVNKRTGALGFAQVMPQNIVGWGKNAGKKKHGWDFEALGYDITPQQFLANPELQKKIVDFQLKKAFDKYGAEGAARWWYSNSAKSSDKRPTPNEPSPNEYANSVLNRMRNDGGINAAAIPNKKADDAAYLSRYVGDKKNTQSEALNVSVSTTVHPNGGTTTKVATPQSVKISHNQPGTIT